MEDQHVNANDNLDALAADEFLVNLYAGLQDGTYTTDAELEAALQVELTRLAPLEGKYGHLFNSITIDEPIKGHDFDKKEEKDKNEKELSDKEKKDKEQDERNKRAFKEKRHEQEFYCKLLGKTLTAELNELKKELLSDMNPQEDDSNNVLSIAKNKIKSHTESHKRKHAVKQVGKFLDYCLFLESGDSKAVDKTTADYRYIFQAQVYLYNLMLLPWSNDNKDKYTAYSQCLSYSQQLSGGTDVKQILLGLLLIAAGAALIGLTAGFGAAIAVGVGIPLYMVISGGIGLGMAPAMAGLRKLKNNVPFFNRGLSWRAGHVAWSIKHQPKKSGALINQLRKFGDDGHGSDKDKGNEKPVLKRKNHV